METLLFDKLLLKTAFSCMACDGDIDDREIQLIKSLHEDNQEFGEVNIDSELENLLASINTDGHEFFRTYFAQLTDAQLTEIEEMKLIEVAVDTIKADEKVEYGEIKFFKVIRSKLNVKDEQIIEQHPNLEDYLEKDIITDGYLARIQDDFFDSHEVKELSLSKKIDENFIKDIKNDENNSVE